MFSDEEIKDIPVNDASDQLFGFRPICVESRTDHSIWPVNEPQLSHQAPARIDLATENAGRWAWQKDGLCGDFQDWWSEEDRSVSALVSHSSFGSTNLPFPDLEDGIKAELKEPEHASQFKSEKQPPSPSCSRSPAAVSSSSTPAATAPISSSREFQHQYTLMRHLPTHTDERNFHCHQCGKSFRQLSTLSQHRAIHSADRPYSCEVCRKTFNRVSTLISHRKTHSGNKPYKCHICPKGFYQKGNLRNHLFTHTNERPYRCEICYKGFNQQSNLVCHKNKVHPEEGASCILPCSDSSTTTIKQEPTLVHPNMKMNLTNTLSSTPRQMSSIVEAVQTMDVGSAPSQQDLFSLNGVQWDWLQESCMEPDLAAGVIVDPIKTYQMGVAQATRQTPFALLRPEHGAPVLVKVVETNLPGGKQMLVPATAEDLRIGGKIIINKDDQQENPGGGSESHAVGAATAVPAGGAALQIRVPVVATVVPRLQPGGQLLLAVEEPHASATGFFADPMMPVGVGAGAAREGCTRSRDLISAYTPRGDDPVFGNLQVRHAPPPVAPPPSPLPPPVSPCRGLELFGAELPTAPADTPADIFLQLERLSGPPPSFCIQLSDSE